MHLDLFLELGVAVCHLGIALRQRPCDRRHVEVVLDQLGDARVAVVEARKHGGCEGPGLAQCLVAIVARARAFSTSGRVGLVGIPERYLLGRSTPSGASVDTPFVKSLGGSLSAVSKPNIAMK